MVSARCKMAVKEELKKLGLHFIVVDLGEVEIMEDITAEQRLQLKNGLQTYGFELIEDNKAVIIGKIKAAIVEMIHHTDGIIKTNFSDYLSEKLNYDYTYLANLFSETQGTTIEQFMISHKVERIKELIIYDELNISEIAWKMNYSSVSHLSNQFKKVTGLSPSHFKQLKDKRRTPIEDIGEPIPEHFGEQKTAESISTEFNKDVIDNLLSGDSKAIQSNEQQYNRSLIEASLDPLVTIDAEGKITDINEALVQVTGFPRERIIGSDFSKYFTEPEKVLQGHKMAFEKGSVTDYQLTIIHKNGQLTEVAYNASVYKDIKGQVLGIFAAARVISPQKWPNELKTANKEIAFQNYEKENRAAELVIANKELAFQNEEKEKRANELIIANKELEFQNEEKEKRAAELLIANEELLFQNAEKEKRANELLIANKELAYQNREKEKRADELLLANKELIFQNNEKEKRAAEYIITGKELAFQTQEKEKGKIANSKLEANSDTLKIASQYTLSLIEASHDPLVTINIEGKITDMNEATVKITGITRVKLTGTDFFNYFTDPGKAREVYKEVFAKGSVSDSPLTLRHKDGKLTDVLFNGSVYKDDSGKVQGIVVVARDVTEQKRIAAELTEAIVFAEMATSYAEEAKAKAENATHVAEDAVKAKQLFLSNMSHEIRTPMNAIIGFTKVILKTELTSKQREYLKAIKMSGDALIVLINDILDLAKVDSGKMVFEQIPFKLSLSLAAMLHLFEPKIQEKNLKLIKEYDSRIPDVMVGDPVRLHQIILNLVSNAVKFTSHGEIKVSVQLLTQDDASVTVEFAVTDTGIGIKEEKLSTIFENFQQASSGTSRLYGGTGLGLAIVKQLVEAQDGTINVVSKLNEGSTFSFTLSFQKTKSNVELESELIKLDPELSNLKVLVVEDIVLNQLLMRTLLDDFGFECDIASNGKIAIDKIQNNRYDIVLMDLQMPEMNGFEATDYIRNTLLLDIPIIALTADVTTVDLAKCKAVGMNDYIAKPVDERILYSKMVGLVKKPLNSNESETKATMDKAYLVEEVKTRCTNLNYLNIRTKSNPILMMEMISLYLNQTPPLIVAMKTGFKEKDWNSLYTAVHKMIPSFSIMGISTDIENIAKKVQEFASNQKQSEGIQEMVLKLESVCGQACSELEEELYAIKIKHDG